MVFEGNRFRNVRRKATSLKLESVVKTGFLASEDSAPLVIEPTVDNVKLATWAMHNKAFIEEVLLKYGAILFRNFNIKSAMRFEELARAITPELLDYCERSSPRTELSRGIYTSTDYPADQIIQFHNEQSYSHSWPMKLWFFCERTAEQGGATPIADCRKVFRSLDRKLRDRFTDKKVLYLRNYGNGLGLSWQTAFQTNDKVKVENYCRRVGIGFKWKVNNELQTRQVFDAIVGHPKTGELIWFEHVAFFHISSLEPSIREILLSNLDEGDLPFNTYYGDGGQIEASVLDEIREAYRQAAVRFAWEEGDVMLIDNMLTAHAREKYVGPRKIVVAMAELFLKSGAYCCEATP